MEVFDKPGFVNTERTCRIAVEKALLLKAPIVSATTEGGAGAALCEIAGKMGFNGSLVIVTHAFGSRKQGINVLKEEHRTAMLASGARLITAAHVLSGAERALSTKFQGAYPVEIVAHTLRMLSQGMKVVVEIACMAMDAGAVDYGSDIVCIGGTGRGLDTAVVMKPAYTKDLFETKIHEVLCLPY